MEITGMTAVQLGSCIRRREITPKEAVEASLSVIHKTEGQINAFITVDEEGAIRRAEQVQRGLEEGRLWGPLVGVPVAVKDNICIKGIPTTCASRMLERYIPAYTAEAVRRLEAAGAIVVGKTNMDEFAMGSTTETSAFGPTHNPVDPEYVPGGSSGGSCAAVAAGEVPLALGSDTGGSIRQPSAFCGVIGLKPTYGTVSRYGLVAYGSSLEQIGPVAGNVTDCAAAIQVIAGWDPADSTSINRDDPALMRRLRGESAARGTDPGGLDFMGALRDEVSGLRVGIPRDYFGPGLDLEVRERVLEAARVLRDRGAETEEFDLGLVQYAIPAYYVIACAEASSNLARYDGVKYGHRAEHFAGLHEMYKRSRSEGFGSEVKRRIMLGSFVLSAGYYDDYYLKALKVRTLIKRSFDQAFRRYDVLLGPTAPTTAPRIGESLSDPLKMYLGDIYTVAANLAGLPGISLPCGRNRQGLPIGLQLLGDCFCEDKILRAAYTCEQAMRAASGVSAQDREEVGQ